jgi:hypothetical protein
MKSFASPSLFRVVDLLLAKSNPHLKLSKWKHEELDCERERHSFNGSNHSFAIEVTRLTRPGRHGWSLMVVKEFWWAGNQGRELRSSHWAQLMSGSRNDALAWLREQERSLELDFDRMHATAVNE